MQPQRDGTRDSKKKKNHVPERSRIAEARKIQGARTVGAYNVSLDMKGTIWSTEELAEQLYRAWTVINGHPYHR